jgi:hypothetical protein
MEQIKPKKRVIPGCKAWNRVMKELQILAVKWASFHIINGQAFADFHARSYIICS